MKILREYAVFIDIDSGEPVPEMESKRKCIIFGAGSMGISIFDQVSLKYDVAAYSDNDPLRWGDIVNAKKIIPVDELAHWTEHGDTDIVVCSFFAADAIIEYLKRMNLNAEIKIPKLLEFVEDDERSTISDEALEAGIEKSRRLYLNTHRDGKIKIVFLVYLPQLFSSYESIYEEMVHDERFEPIIVVSPFRRRSGESKLRFAYEPMLEELMEKRGYPYKWAYKDGQWIDVYSLNPDGIFYQTPYTASQLPSVLWERHYSKHIKIMNTPYGVIPVDDISSLVATANYRDEFLQSCWRLFFDRSNYDAFISNPNLSDKIILSGIPKFDFYVRGIKNKEIYFKDNASKKILYTPTWMAAKGRSSFLQCYDYFYGLLEEKDVELVIRPHPLLIPEIESLGLIAKPELEEILSRFENHKSCLFDYSGDYRCAILGSDFAVMDISSLLYEYLPTGKPLILMAQNEETFRAKSVLKDICYMAENREQLEGYVNMLLDGNDPLREKRLGVVGNLDDLFPNGGSNGAYITNYIARHIRD